MTVDPHPPVQSLSPAARPSVDGDGKPTAASVAATLAEKQVRNKAEEARERGPDIDTQGLHDRESAKYWWRFRELLENQYPVLPFDAAVADIYGGLAAEARRQERPGPVLDPMIAATALHHGLAIATLNARDFDGIPGPSVEDWTQPS